MKKLFITLALLFTIMLSAQVCYSENDPLNKTRLFHNGKTFELNSPVLFLDNEYYLNALELSANLDMKLERTDSRVAIEYKGTRRSFDIRLHQTASSSMKVNHDLPEIIDSELYFPFSLLKSVFKMTIKYNGDNNTLYIFSDSNAAYDFINLTYDYSLGTSSGFRVSTGESETDFQENTISFLNQNRNLTAVLTSDRLDNESLGNMRKYLNDFDSDDKAIFKRFVDYKMSYFSAMQDYYKRDFLYGLSSSASNELNMKVFSEYMEKVFGQDSDIVLYNVIKSEKYSSSEDTYLSITIPVYENMTVYTISFSIPKGKLDTNSLLQMHAFLKDLKLFNLPQQTGLLKVFYDSKSIAAANQGIYPELSTSPEIRYSLISDADGGYELKYPSTFLPFRQNKLVRSLDYKSYKIDSNSFFSVCLERIADESKAIENKTALIKDLHKGKIHIVAEGTEMVENKVYTYIKYNLEGNNGVTYIEDYFYVSDSRLFNIQLNRANILPTAELEKVFKNILGSLKIYPLPAVKDEPLNSFTQLSNKEEGYSLISPSQWSIKEIDNNDINYNSYVIKNSDYSGPVEVLLNEGELNSGLSYTDILKFVTGNKAPELQKYFKKYSAPYLNRINQTLYTSYRQSNGAVYLYKLINYLDSTNRGKICYSIDIIRDRKIYSLFITASDYMTSNGILYDTNLISGLDLIANSFNIENTKEYHQRKLTGETRNKKVLFLEGFLKKHTNNNTTRVDSVECLGSEENLLVGASDKENSKIYWIKADFSKSEAEILQTTDKSSLLLSMTERLREMFKDKDVEGVKLFEDTMKFEVKYKEGINQTVITRSYQVVGSVKNDMLNWKLDRSDYSNAVKNDCKEFLQNLLGDKVNIHFNPEQDFAEIKKYKDKGQLYNVPVFVQFGEFSGYFTLSINPYNDRVSIESYMPFEKIQDKVNKLFSMPKSDYIIYNIGMDETNKFEFHVLLVSKYRVSYKLSKVKVSLNPETNVLELN